MRNFVHLHLHSEYSLLDGACRIDKLIEKIKDLNQNAVAITDHGVMYSTIEFYKKAINAGLKPIIGCEVYVAPRTRFDKDFKMDIKPYHLTLLCENNIGYNNLIKLVSLSYKDGFYKKPRIDRDLLTKYHEGLICLSGCIGGELSSHIRNNNFNEARNTAIFYKNLFGDNNYYIEIQRHPKIDDDGEMEYITNQLINLSLDLNIPLVATNDVHYINKEDSKMHRVLLAIQTGTTLSELKLDFGSDEFYVKTSNQMYDLFKDLPDAIDNTVKIADRCNVSFEFGNIKLPKFFIDTVDDNNKFFKNLCYNGLINRYGKNPESYIKEKLDYEISIIEQMGYIDYFLIVYDFVKYAKNHDIPVGPGRGSGAGSLAAYCMEITDIDPVKYNLLFERFLNPERISMPDFDIDFCYEKRQKVIDYVIDKYGLDHVAQIVTFGTMAAKMAIRDVVRVLDMPYQVGDSIAKMIPPELNMTIDKALDISVDLRNIYETDEKIRELIDMARKIEGMPRHTSTHAAGIVITKDPVDEYVPLQKLNESIMTQYTMGTLEELGLLKMDFLGLRTLTVIYDAEKMVRKNNPDFNIKKIPYDDKKVFEMLSKGLSEGVFQFESVGMKQVLTRLKPENIEDIIAVISLYRPGPMESIPKYIEYKHNPFKIVYKHPLLENILKVTYGCIVYQEQVMQICRELAGYSYGRADLVRRAMSKKKMDVMEKERKNFVYGAKKDDGTIECVGAINNGVSEKVAHEIFDEMVSFASYAFNKSHAAAYATLSYQTAYLKCYFPKEFMAAILTSVIDNINKVLEYIDECSRLGIKVTPPDVNISNAGFIVSGDDVNFGLVAIKGVGRGFINELVREREINGNFKSFGDFCNRMYGKEVTKKNIENLIKAGAFDKFNKSRKAMLQKYALVIDAINHQQKSMMEGQLSFFDMGDKQGHSNYEQYDRMINELEDLSYNEKLNMEKEVVGIYISGNPLDQYQKLISENNFMKLSTINNKNDKIYDKMKVCLIGVISDVNIKVTKKTGRPIAFVTLEDKSSKIGLLFFAEILDKFKNLLVDNNIVIVKGNINLQDGKEPNIIVNDISLAQNFEKIDNLKENYLDNLIVERKNIKKKGLYLKIDNQNSIEMKKSELILSIFNGNTPVYIFFKNLNKLLLAPRSLWVDVNLSMLKELKNILGEQNVICIK